MFIVSSRPRTGSTYLFTLLRKFYRGYYEPTHKDIEYWLSQPKEKHRQLLAENRHPEDFLYFEEFKKVWSSELHLLWKNARRQKKVFVETAPAIVEYFRYLDSLHPEEEVFFKEPCFSLSLEWMRRELPEMKIISLVRDPFEIYLSHVKTQKKLEKVWKRPISLHELYGFGEAVTAFKERGIDLSDLSYEDQIRVITEESDRIAHEYSDLVVTYDELCEDPEGLIKKIKGVIEA